MNAQFINKRLKALMNKIDKLINDRAFYYVEAQTWEKITADWHCNRLKLEKQIVKLEKAIETNKKQLAELKERRPALNKGYDECIENLNFYTRKSNELHEELQKLQEEKSSFISEHGEHIDTSLIKEPTPESTRLESKNNEIGEYFSMLDWFLRKGDTVSSNSYQIDKIINIFRYRGYPIIETKKKNSKVIYYLLPKDWLDK